MGISPRRVSSPRFTAHRQHLPTTLGPLMPDDCARAPTPDPWRGAEPDPAELERVFAALMADAPFRDELLKLVGWHWPRIERDLRGRRP